MANGGAASASHLLLPSGGTVKEMGPPAAFLPPSQRSCMYIERSRVTAAEPRRSTARPARTCWRRRRRRRPPLTTTAGSRAGARPRRRRGGPRWGRSGATPPFSWRRTACAGTGSSSCTTIQPTHQIISKSKLSNLQALTVIKRRFFS